MASTQPPKCTPEKEPVAPAEAITTLDSGDKSADTGTLQAPPVPSNTDTAPISSSSSLNTSRIPIQFLFDVPSTEKTQSPPDSPRGLFTSTYSLKSELENIRLSDHCFVSRGPPTDPDDEYPDPEDINLSSLMSRMRQMRSSGQITYRLPKKRRREDEPKDTEDDEMEVVTIPRQKRVRKTPRGPRSEKRMKEEKEKEKEMSRRRMEWGAAGRRPIVHPPMVLETVKEVEMETVQPTIVHPIMTLQEDAKGKEEIEGQEMILAAE